MMMIKIGIMLRILSLYIQKIVCLEEMLSKLLNNRIYSKYIHRYMDWITLLFTIINVIALCIYDYSNRITFQNIEINRVAIGMEILCNIYFGLEMAA